MMIGLRYLGFHACAPVTLQVYIFWPSRFLGRCSQGFLIKGKCVPYINVLNEAGRMRGA